MENEIVTINSRKYDMNIRRSWNCKLFERRDPLLAFAGEFEMDVDHPDIGFITRGTLSYEYYWLDRWYNVFCFYEPDGTFRNFYCNINMPPTFENNVLDYIDLDIDVLVQPDHSYRVLDLEEFELNSVKFNYSASVILNTMKTLEDVIGSIENRDFPFNKL